MTIRRRIEVRDYSPEIGLREGSASDVPISGFAGLAGVTPACGFIHPMAGLLIGGLAGVVCYFMCTTVKARWR